MWLINRYTIGAGIAAAIFILVWLQFGGAISAWSAGVGRALKGNAAAIDELKKANESAESARAEKLTAERELGEIEQKVKALQRQIEQKQAEVVRLRDTNSQLARKFIELETKLANQPKITTIEEAYRALQALGPPYSRSR